MSVLKRTPFNVLYIIIIITVTTVNIRNSKNLVFPVTEWQLHLMFGHIPEDIAAYPLQLLSLQYCNANSSCFSLSSILLCFTLYSNVVFAGLCFLF